MLFRHKNHGIAKISSLELFFNAMTMTFHLGLIHDSMIRQSDIIKTLGIFSRATERKTINCTLNASSLTQILK